MCWTLRGPAPRRSAGGARHGAAGLTVALVVALACGCANTGPAPVAEAAYGVHIDTNTPQGLRAKQTMDMLNSDWPIGPVGVRTLAAPELVDEVGTKLDSIWWDRPFRVTGVDIGAGQATLHVLTSYNVAQNIELRTNGDGLVDRFAVTLQPPVITKWADIDTELTKSGAVYSYQLSRVTDGKCALVAGTNTDLSLPLASIFKLYVLLAVAEAVSAGTVNWNDQLTITTDKAVGSAGLQLQPDGSIHPVRAAEVQAATNFDRLISQNPELQSMIELARPAQKNGHRNRHHPPRPCCSASSRTSRPPAPRAVCGRARRPSCTARRDRVRAATPMHPWPRSQTDRWQPADRRKRASGKRRSCPRLR